MKNRNICKRGGTGLLKQRLMFIRACVHAHMHNAINKSVSARLTKYHYPKDNIILLNTPSIVLGKKFQPLQNSNKKVIKSILKNSNLFTVYK